MDIQLLINKLQKKIIKKDTLFFLRNIILIPYKTHGIHAAACAAFGNLKSSVTFKLQAISSADSNDIELLKLKLFNQKYVPSEKIEIADIV